MIGNKDWKINFRSKISLLLENRIYNHMSPWSLTVSFQKITKLCNSISNSRAWNIFNKQMHIYGIQDIYNLKSIKWKLKTCIHLSNESWKKHMNFYYHIYLFKIFKILYLTICILNHMFTWTYNSHCVVLNLNSLSCQFSSTWIVVCE